MLTGVAVVLLLLVALLAIPVTLAFNVSWPQAVPNDIRLQWAFGLVRTGIASSQSEATSPESEKRASKTKRAKSAPRKKYNYVAAIRQKSFRRRIGRFVGDLWRAVHKKDVRLNARVGLGDPADTGQLWALFGPVSGVLANVRDASIRLEPDFLDSTLELDSGGVIRLIPLQIIYLAGALLLSPPVWRGLMQMRSAG